MTFTDVHKTLFQTECIVEYQSLTSSKIHKLLCTLKKKIQSQGDKIVVWDIKTNTYHDIEINTIISINPLEKTHIDHI